MLSKGRTQKGGGRRMHHLGRKDYVGTIPSVLLTDVWMPFLPNTAVHCRRHGPPSSRPALALHSIVRIVLMRSKWLLSLVMHRLHSWPWPAVFAICAPGHRGTRAGPVHLDLHKPITAKRERHLQAPTRLMYTVGCFHH